MPSLSTSSRIPAHLSLTLVGLMWVLPFLYPSHAYPLTTFYQEWIAVVLGLAAVLGLLALGGWREFRLPAVMALPFGLLLVLLVQLVQGKLSYVGQAQLLAEYLLWMALLLWLGLRLRQQLGLAGLVTALAGFCLLGAELNALAGILQHYHWHTPLDRFVTNKVAVAVYGNLAQPNHYADQMALGLVSLGLLASTRKLPGWLTPMVAAPLLFVMVLSGSRTSWFYFAALVLLAFPGRRATAELRWLWHYSLAVLAGFVVMHGVVKLPWLATDGLTSFSRLYQESGGNSIRLYLWREALQIWADYPLFGAGFGQFAWQHFVRLPGLANPAISGLYNNAHNLPLQLAAETGLAGLLVVVGALFTWWWRTLSLPASPWKWWGYAVCVVLGLHSLLEYPLWYAYFLGIAALVLGALEPEGRRLQLPRLGWGVAVALTLGGVFAATQLLSNYRQLEAATTVSRLVSADDTARTQHVVTELQALARQPELSAYAELYLNPMYRVDEQYLNFKHPLNQRVLHAFPIGQTAYREVVFLAIAGRMQEAEVLLEQAIWSYPGEFAAAREQLEVLARKDPARYAALLKFALQKFEEHQRAVSAG